MYSRRVVGWAMSPSMDRPLATTALTMALTHRRPRSGLIHHTDQGCQYAATCYRQVLAQNGLAARMRRAGDTDDKAGGGGFFCPLRKNRGQARTFHTPSAGEGPLFGV